MDPAKAASEEAAGKNGTAVNAPAPEEVSQPHHFFALLSPRQNV